MSFAVPESQTVSWAIYWPSIIREADVSVEADENYRQEMIDAGRGHLLPHED